MTDGQVSSDRRARFRYYLLLAQRFARHASPLTTVIYTHLADERPAAGVRDLLC